jgi:hypothetical protein
MDVRMADAAIEDFEEEFVVFRRGEDAVAMSWDRHSELLAGAQLDSEEKLDGENGIIFISQFKIPHMQHDSLDRPILYYLNKYIPTFG